MKDSFDPVVVRKLCVHTSLTEVFIVLENVHIRANFLSYFNWILCDRLKSACHCKFKVYMFFLLFNHFFTAIGATRSRWAD